MGNEPQPPVTVDLPGLGLNRHDKINVKVKDHPRVQPDSRGKVFVGLDFGYIEPAFDTDGAINMLVAYSYIEKEGEELRPVTMIFHDWLIEVVERNPNGG